jgi:predicted membrane channel-forming protein YqfA (hemolysin III family)
VTAEEWVLAGAAFFSGLASGLLGMLTTIMHPMLGAMDGREFRNFMEAFLRFARKAWFNYAWSLGMGIAPIAALVLLWDDAGSTAFVLTAIGLVIVIVGVYLVSNLWKEPQYDVILGWDPDALPADWEAGRRRYFTINWIQFATTWSAFALFLVALASL